MHKEKINLLGFSHESLVDFFQSIMQPSFRALQLMKWIHQRGVLDLTKMTDFSYEVTLEKVTIVGQTRFFIGFMETHPQATVK